MLKSLFTISKLVGLALVLSTGSTLHAEVAPANLPKCEDKSYDFKTESRIEPGVGNMGYDAYKARAQRKLCRKEWTVLMFMNVDDNLKPQALWDIHEIEAAYEKSVKVRAASTGVMDVVAELGYTNDTKSRRIHMQQGVCPYLWRPRSLNQFNKATEVLRTTNQPEFQRLYGNCPGIDPVKGAVDVHTKKHFETHGPEHIQSPVVEKVDLSQPLSTASYKERLASFVKWAVQEYPSEHFALVLWGHGEGLRMVSGSNTMLFTGKEPTFADAPSVRAGLASIQEFLPADQFQQRRLDVLISDSCLMQMAEVVSEVQSVARYVVGSQQTQTGLGLPYRYMFYEISTGRYKDPKITYCGNWKMGKDRFEDLNNLPARLAGRVPCQMERSLSEFMNETKIRSRVLGPQLGYDATALRDFTLSAVSADHVKDYVVPALRKLGAALMKYLNEPVLNGKPDYDRGAEIYEALLSLPNYLGGSRDLGAVGELLEEVLQAQAKKLKKKNLSATEAMVQMNTSLVELRQALTLSTLDWIQGPGYMAKYPISSMSGMSVWIPTSIDNYKARMKDMSESTMYKWTTTQRFSGGYDRVDGRRVPRPPREMKVVGWPDWIDFVFGN